MTQSRTISGTTAVVGIIADPIEHVRTPQLFNALMAAQQRDTAMVPLRVAPQSLGGFMSGIVTVQNLIGLVVTLPHKEAVLDHCTRLTAAARRVRAANVIRFNRPQGETIGTNTDGEGFLAGLKAQGHDVRGKAVYLAGAGGAAKAIADALLGSGIAALGIHNRTEVRAAELVGRLREDYPAADIHAESGEPRQYDIAINATSLGLNAGDALPFRLDRLPPAALVAEVVMKTEITPLLAAARERGNPIHPGRHMLDGQIQSIARFLGCLK